MDTHSTKFKARLGLFVIGGILLLVTGIFLIGRQKNLFDPIFHLTSTFYNVSGLQVGNTVRFSGINVGTVNEIKIINDSTVQVELIVKTSVQEFIKIDCQMAIGSEGIIGDRVLLISQGSSASPSVKDGQSLTSIEPVETDAIMASLQVTAGNAEIISDQMAEVMYKINHGNGTLGRLIEDSTIAENLNQTIVNLKKSTKGLDENMKAASNNFLLKGYFTKKEKEAARLKKEAEKKEEEKNK
ncbi:hypothetical protein BH11BAC1_BH11BAC1_04930 [soil metagenome]